MLKCGLRNSASSGRTEAVETALADITSGCEAILGMTHMNAEEQNRHVVKTHRCFGTNLRGQNKARYSS